MKSSSVFAESNVSTAKTELDKLSCIVTYMDIIKSFISHPGGLGINPKTVEEYIISTDTLIGIVGATELNRMDDPSPLLIELNVSEDTINQVYPE